ncbi:MAG: hypothetical protein JOZ29_10750 [Deltaproteobacteria bacterium]|nr:hypothetical protein [Deltaproteobacteria bacterium]
MASRVIELESRQRFKRELLILSTFCYSYRVDYYHPGTLIIDIADALVHR